MKFDLLENDRFIIRIFWVFVFFMLWFQVFPQTESIIESVLFIGLLIISILPFSNYLSNNLLLKAMKTKKIIVFVLQFIGISSLVGIIFALITFLFYLLEQNGIFPLSSYFDMNFITPYTAIFVVISTGGFINMCLCGIRFLLEYIKAQKILTGYQLRSLQHQITPHFMFNVLNHVHILMQTDVTLASELLIKYSDILRYQLYNGEKEYVKLEQDIQFLKDFIAVEEVRWGDKLTVNSEWKIEDIQMKIPALLFITFIENAFKYVSKSDLEQGYINITFEQKENKIEFEIENSKSQLKYRGEQSSGLGLKNIKERLDILYNGKHTIRIDDSDSSFHVELVIYIH